MPSRLILPCSILQAAVSYWAAMSAGMAAPWLVMVSMAALCTMVRLKTARRAFYAGIAAALAVYVPQLWFLTGIFQLVAIPLWICLAVWTGLFCGTLHVLHRKWGPVPALLTAPVLWLGLEQIRCEIWALKFTWLTPGYALPADRMGWLFQSLGVYGSGALLVLAGASLVLLKKPRFAVLALSLALPALLLPGSHQAKASGEIRVTGIQLELDSPNTEMVRDSLDAARTQYPDTSLFVLPELTFPGTIPKDITDWCRKHGKYLIAGGREYPKGLFNNKGLRAYYNTAWVIGPEGTVVHRQAKATPIQFFDDGMPAATQQLWDSPWGRIGICICYDQNYAGVTDPLAAQGMQALIIPTMDVLRWGVYQHKLSARLASTRAVEYGVPVVRVASSGVSLMLDARGHALATGSVPGQGEILSAVLPLSSAPRKPWDRLPARLAVIPACFLVVLALALSFVDERRRVHAAKLAKPAGAGKAS